LSEWAIGVGRKPRANDANNDEQNVQTDELAEQFSNHQCCRFVNRVRRELRKA